MSESKTNNKASALSAEFVQVGINLIFQGFLIPQFVKLSRGEYSWESFYKAEGHLFILTSLIMQFCFYVFFVKDQEVKRSVLKMMGILLVILFVAVPVFNTSFSFEITKEQTQFTILEYNGIWLTDECQDKWDNICADLDYYKNGSHADIFDCCNGFDVKAWKFAEVFKYLTLFSFFIFVNLLLAAAVVLILKWRGKMTFI